MEIGKFSDENFVAGCFHTVVLGGILFSNEVGISRISASGLGERFVSIEMANAAKCGNLEQRTKIYRLSLVLIQSFKAGRGLKNLSTSPNPLLGETN